MNRDVYLRPEANADLEEAYHYYEKCGKGLGEDLVHCVEDVLQKLSENPKHYPVIHRRVRRALIHRFPYGIFFVEEENRLVVTAIMHFSRNPTRWLGRV